MSNETVVGNVFHIESALNPTALSVRVCFLMFHILVLRHLLELHPKTASVHVLPRVKPRVNVSLIYKKTIQNQKMFTGIVSVAILCFALGLSKYLVDSLYGDTFKDFWTEFVYDAFTYFG